MSPKIKRLSGKEVISILSKFGFVQFSQRGSHVKLRRVFMEEKQTLTLVMHDELDIGTLRAILRQASRYIPEDQLRKEFYYE